VRAGTWRYAWELIDLAHHRNCDCNLCTPLVRHVLAGGQRVRTLYTDEDERERAEIAHRRLYRSVDHCARDITAWLTRLQAGVTARAWTLLQRASGGTLTAATFVAEALGAAYYERAEWHSEDAPHAVHLQPRECVRRLRTQSGIRTERYAPRFVVQTDAAALLERPDYVVRLHPHWWNVLLVLPRGAPLRADVVERMRGRGPAAERGAPWHADAFVACSRAALLARVAVLRERIAHETRRLRSGPPATTADTQRTERALHGYRDAVALAEAAVTAATAPAPAAAPAAAVEAPPAAAAAPRRPRAESPVPLRPAIRRASGGASGSAGSSGGGGGGGLSRSDLAELAALREQLAAVEALKQRVAELESRAAHAHARTRLQEATGDAPAPAPADDDEPLAAPRRVPSANFGRRTRARSVSFSPRQSLMRSGGATASYTSLPAAQLGTAARLAAEESYSTLPAGAVGASGALTLHRYQASEAEPPPARSASAEPAAAATEDAGAALPLPTAPEHLVDGGGGTLPKLTRHRSLMSFRSRRQSGGGGAAAAAQ
jgi:hypothetical protein